jgi:type II secretory pathway component GspD/PulD (secretin)
MPHRISQMKRAFLPACLLAASTVSLAQGSLEVLPLRHRSAEHVIPVLRGLLEPGAAMTGQGYQVFVRTSPANLEELKRALAAVDSPQRPLVISVRFDRAFETQRTSGRSSVGERVDQRIQVLEGARAMISAGQSRPLTQRQVSSGPGGTTVRETTQIQDIGTGFEVTPRVSGNTVFLEIHPQREIADARGSVQTHRVSSSISAPLGEWVELGSAEESSARSAAGVLSSREARFAQTRGVWVRVEESRP